VNWLQSLQLRGAAKSYALRLPAYLKQAYGASEAYSPAQIAHAVTTLDLKQRYIALAYAAYVSEAEFAELRADLPIKMQYGGARAEFFRHVPEPEPTDAWNPLVSGSLTGGWSSESR
jgi:hypothetical protein